MIRGVHTMFYSSEADGMRDFIRNNLGFSFTDVGQGWLIFNLPEADLGVHPSDDSEHGRPGTHAISFYCDKIEKTVAGMKAKGVEFTAPIEDHGYGLVTFFKMPGGVLVQLYQPHYKKKKPAAKRPAARRLAARPRRASRRTRKSKS